MKSESNKKNNKRTVSSKKKTTTVDKKSKKSSKSIAKDKLKKLITPSRKKQLEDVAVDEMRDALSNDLSIKSESGNNYRLTPKGILLAVLDKYYGAGEDLKTFDDFMKDLC